MIAAFDLDGTLLKKNGSFAFCDFLCEKGFLSKRDMMYYAYTYTRHLYFGLSFINLHTLIFKRSFQGCEVASLNPYIEEFIKTRLPDLWYMPAVLRMQRMRKRGFECMILSNSPRFFVEHVAKQLEIEKVYATDYAVDEQGRFTHLSLLMDGDKKKELIQNFNSQNTIAFSDSHHDLPFLRAAHVAVAVNPVRRLRKLAASQGWEIL